MSAEQCLIYVSVNKNILNKNQTKANLATDWVPVELSTEVFAQVIKNGWAYSAWFTDQKRSKDNFAGINIASVDIDGTRSIDETIRDPFCEQYLSLLYTTHSHTTENPRFRLVFLLPRVIEKSIEYRHILQALSTKLKGDPSATDPSRLFYGNTNASITTWDRSLTEEELCNLLETYPRKDLHHPGHGPTTLVLQSSSPLNEELDLLDSHGKAIKLGEIKARISVFCPFHSDTNPSAFVGIKPNGERFLHCSKCQSTWHQKSKFLKNTELYDFQNVLKKVSELDLDQRLKVLNRLSDDYLEKTLIEKTAEAGIHFVSDRHFKLPEIIEGLTLIKSPKGTGKTESVSTRIVDSMFKRRHLTLADFEELESDSDSPPQSLTERTQYRVLLIGHRQALIRSLCKRFDLHCYLDDGPLYDISSRTRDQYGVCIDSIYKVSLDDRPYDLVIIDESEQVLAHFLSTTMRDRLSFYQGFSTIIRHAKSVIAMDADLGWTTYLTLTSIRSKSLLTRGKNKLLIYINDYVAPNQKIKIYESKSQLISEIWVDIRLGKKIFISSNSKERVQRLAAKITEDFSSIEVLSITSENSTVESVQEFISNVRLFAPKYQVILASPSLGTGVDISFDNNQVVFDCVYGIFETPINTHTEIDQQISRVRNPKEVKIWISPRKFNFESDFQVIKAELLPSNVVANTVFSISNSIASAVFSDQSGDFIRLAALVLSEQMRSKNALKSNYIRYKQKGGWSITLIDSKDHVAEGKQIDSRAKQLSDERYIKLILNATPIDRDTYDSIRDKINDNYTTDPIDDHERWSYIRMRLEIFYRKVIDRDIIISDRHGELRRSYYRYSRLLDVRKHKKFREKISLYGRKTSRNFLKLIPESLGEIDGMLLREVLISSHLFDGQSFDCDKEIHSSHLEMFVEVVTKLKPFLERQIDFFSVRNDLLDKPVQQLGLILKLIGLRLLRTRTSRNASGGKDYHYRIDPASVLLMAEIHSQQTSGVDPWQAINERYGFVATDYLIDSTGMDIDELMSHWLKEQPLDRSRSLGPV